MKIEYVSTENCEYWSGHHLPVLQMAINPGDKEITKWQMLDFLGSYEATEHIEDLDVREFENALAVFKYTLSDYEDHDPLVFIMFPQEVGVEQYLYAYFILQPTKEQS